MKVLTSEQMRRIDQLTTERCALSFLTLMENAGTSVVKAIQARYGDIEGKRFAVFCGRGNNGGDGAVIARLLLSSRAGRVDVYQVADPGSTKDAARVNFERLTALSSDSRLKLFPTGQNLEEFKPSDYDIVVDALLGTGIDRPVTGVYERAIDVINLSFGTASIVSVDIPSGLPSDSSFPNGPHVSANLTVCFTAPKPANVLSPSCESGGELVVASIGTPGWLISKESGSELELVEKSSVARWLAATKRPTTAHKTAVGNVLLVAGSVGKTGAAALAAEACLRSGAGLITVATSQTALPLLVSQVIPEAMTISLDSSLSGAISSTAVEKAKNLMSGRSCVALGPGLGAGEDTAAFVRGFTHNCTVPLILDADGLNCLAPWTGHIKGGTGQPVIITPHPGEMARLSASSTEEIAANRLVAANRFSVNTGVITVLKGSRTVIGSPDGRVFINPTGNAGMATAGSGDVLTGLLSGLLAQAPHDALGATIAAVYLHGLAGDFAAARLGQRSMIASDITASISAAILSVEEAA